MSIIRAPFWLPSCCALVLRKPCVDNPCLLMPDINRFGCPGHCSLLANSGRGRYCWGFKMLPLDVAVSSSKSLNVTHLTFEGRERFGQLLTPSLSLFGTGKNSQLGTCQITGRFPIPALWLMENDRIHLFSPHPLSGRQTSPTFLPRQGGRDQEKTENHSKLNPSHRQS